MTCESARLDRTIERYLTGELTIEEREAWERHCFSCEACFADAQAGRALQDVLREQAEAIRRTAPIVPVWLWWAGLAACVTLAIFFGSRATRQEAAALKPVPKKYTPVERIRAPETLEDVSKFTPPVYDSALPVSNRNPLLIRFREAMEFYRRGEYAQAIPRLKSIAESTPKAVDVQFFLGICYLMQGQIQLAEERLQTVVGTEYPPIMEDARYYLAVVYLKEKRIEDAREQLRFAALQHGPREVDVNHLLEQLSNIAPN